MQEVNKSGPVKRSGDKNLVMRFFIDLFFVQSENELNFVQNCVSVTLRTSFRGEICLFKGDGTFNYWTRFLG